jgi:hypothetical protein
MGDFDISQTCPSLIWQSGCLAAAGVFHLFVYFGTWHFVLCTLQSLGVGIKRKQYEVKFEKNEQQICGDFYSVLLCWVMTPTRCYMLATNRLVATKVTVTFTFVVFIKILKKWSTMVTINCVLNKGWMREYWQLGYHTYFKNQVRNAKVKKFNVFVSHTNEKLNVVHFIVTNLSKKIRE